MILRRIGEAARRQDWFVVVLEIFIVVFGVFIGLQVDDWNKARQDRALEHEYLERLYADLEYTLESRGRASEWDETRMAQQTLVLNALRSGHLAEGDREAFGTGLALFGFVSGIEIRWSTVDELRATGAMNLIRDVSLRSRILNLDATIARRQGISGKFLDSIYAFRHQIGDRYGIGNFEGERTAVKLVYDFETLAADPGFVNALSQIDYLSRFRADLNEMTLAEIRDFRDDLAQRLDKEGDKTQ